MYMPTKILTFEVNYGYRAAAPVKKKLSKKSAAHIKQSLSVTDKYTYIYH